MSSFLCRLLAAKRLDGVSTMNDKTFTKWGEHDTEWVDYSFYSFEKGNICTLLSASSTLFSFLFSCFFLCFFLTLFLTYLLSFFLCLSYFFLPTLRALSNIATSQTFTLRTFSQPLSTN